MDTKFPLYTANKCEQTENLNPASSLWHQSSALSRKSGHLLIKVILIEILFKELTKLNKSFIVKRLFHDYFHEDGATC